jgi:NifB/MoaA-like Fe-S oxidoreductase
VIEIVERWQERYQEALGRRLVFVADEYYLMAGQAFPAPDAYDGFPQHENGIGMARTFESEVQRAVAGEDVDGAGPRSGFFAWVDGAPATGYRAPRSPGLTTTRPPEAPIAILTGEYGRQVLAPLLPLLQGVAASDVRLVEVPNRFFGGNIGVTGLLTSADVAAALAVEPAEHRYLLPDVVLSQGRFLDGGSIDDLPRPVEVVPTDGASLVAALR